MDKILSYKSDSTVKDYNAVMERLELALLTERGSISADPDFGFNVLGVVDNQLTPDLQHTIKAETIQLITKHFPEVELLGLEISKPSVGVLKINLSVRVLTSDSVLGLNLDYTND